MARFTVGRLKSPRGLLTLYSAQPWVGGARPVVVFLHGLARQAGDLTQWADVLADVADVVLVDLPGHGKSEPVIPATLDELADHVFLGLKTGLGDRQVVLVGESLGGLVALAIAAMENPAPVVAVLAADPPLTTKKQLHVHRRLRNSPPDDPLSRDFLDSLGMEIFGICGDNLSDKIYYKLLEKISVPTKIITGDLNIFPLRPIKGSPCLIDDVDRYVIEHFYAGKIMLRQIQESGHLLLHDRADWSLEQLRELGDCAGVPLRALPSKHPRAGEATAPEGSLR